MRYSFCLALGIISQPASNVHVAGWQKEDHNVRLLKRPRYYTLVQKELPYDVIAKLDQQSGNNLPLINTKAAFARAVPGKISGVIEEVQE